MLKPLYVVVTMSSFPEIMIEWCDDLGFVLLSVYSGRSSINVFNEDVLILRGPPGVSLWFSMFHGQHDLCVVFQYYLCY